MKKATAKKLKLSKLKVANLSTANEKQHKMIPTSFRVYCTGECL